MQRHRRRDAPDHDQVGCVWTVRSSAPNPTSPFTTYGVGYYDQSPLHCIGGHVLFAQSWGYWRSDAPPVFDLIKRPNTVDGHVHCYALWPAVGTNTPNCFDQPGTTF